MGFFFSGLSKMTSTTTRKPRNYVLGGSGVMRFSQSRMYKKRAVHRLKGKQTKATKKPHTPAMKVNEIKGDNNGGKRVVRANRMPKSVDTQGDVQKLKNHKNCFSEHKRNLRPSITPGTVLILLCGRHKGKREVFLKQLASGLLLVTGPYHLNGCPLRRINQKYVIATKTKMDIKGVKLPDRVNDEYFKRQKSQKPKNTEGDIFNTKKEVYAVSEERKEDQSAVDKQILDVIRKLPEKKLMFGYLGAMFSLSNNQFPHKMVF